MQALVQIAWEKVVNTENWNAVWWAPEKVLTPADTWHDAEHRNVCWDAHSCTICIFSFYKSWGHEMWKHIEVSMETKASIHSLQSYTNMIFYYVWGYKWGVIFLRSPPMICPSFLQNTVPLWYSTLIRKSFCLLTNGSCL